MKVIQQYAHTDDISKYKVGDVIKYWNDDDTEARYKMIANVDGKGFLLVSLNGVSGVTDSFWANIPDMIKDNFNANKYLGTYKHFKQVNFYGTDLSYAQWGGQ